jgi:predicted small metal-binding protein
MTEEANAERVLVLRCECGWEARGSEDQIVEATEKHAREAHNMQSTREQILSRAQEA